jgi:hypothetical protein
MIRKHCTLPSGAPSGAPLLSGPMPRASSGPARAARWALAPLCLLLGSACGSAATLVIKPTQPPAAELVPDPRLKQFAYKKILLLPPEQPVALKDLEVQAVAEKPTQYYTAKLEKALVKKGFQVISPEIVARAAQGAKSAKGGLSAAEKAMIMGKKTEADAVFIVQSIGVRGLVKHYALEEGQAIEVEPGLVRVNDDGETVHAETEQCLFTLPYYELTLEAKLVEAASGNVLWLGTGRQRSTDVMRQDWSAEIDDDCELERQNFIYSDYLDDEETLDKTVTALFERMLGPLQTDAAIGQTLVREPPKPPPPPPPPPVEEAKPEPRTAVVSSKVAWLREGPGTNHPKKTKVTRKAKAEVLEVMGEWLKLKLQDGTVGWMHESTLIVNE